MKSESDQMVIGEVVVSFLLSLAIGLWLGNGLFRLLDVWINR